MLSLTRKRNAAFPTANSLMDQSSWQVPAGRQRQPARAAIAPAPEAKPRMCCRNCSRSWGCKLKSGLNEACEKVAGGDRLEECNSANDADGEGAD